MHRRQCGCFARFARFQFCTFCTFCTFSVLHVSHTGLYTGLQYLPIAHARDNRSDAWLHPVDDAGKSRGLPDAFCIEFYGKLVVVLCFLQS